MFLANSCTYHNEDDYFKDNPDICYTEDVSFSADIFPIMESNCISCHNATDLTAGIDLSDYSKIKSLAETNLLLGVIKHNDGFARMPLNASKLSDCDISKLEVWIEKGFMNN